MKRNIKKETNEYYFMEIILAILFISAIIWLGFILKDRKHRIESEPTTTDLIQKQEMIDYAMSEGRTINTY